MAQSPHAGLADLPDFPAQRAARLIADAARDAARAWVQVPDADALDVTWGLHKALGNIGITLWRLTRFRYQDGSTPEALDAGYRRVWIRGRDGLISVPDDPRDPDLLIHRSGFAAVRAGRAIFDLDVLSHVHHQIARGLPVGGDPLSGTPAVTSALALAAASAGARKIMISAEPGPDRFTARHIAARDQAIRSIADAVGLLDETTTNLAATPGPLKNRLAPLHAELPFIQHSLHLAAAWSAARAGGDASRLAATAFPGSPVEAVSAAARTQLVASTAPRLSPGHTARTPGQRAAP